MRKVRRIMCCCSNGVGTSLLMQMTIEEALALLDRNDIEVIFGPLSGMTSDAADLFVVSEALSRNLGDLPAIGLPDLMDAQAAADKLKKFLY